MEAIMFKLPNQAPVEITLNVVGYGPNGYINFYHRGQIIGTLGSNNIADFAEQIKQAGEHLTPYTVAEAEARKQYNVLDMSPQDVIDYFYNSPQLREIAADVRAILESPGYRPGQLSRDLAIIRPQQRKILNYDNTPQWGAQTRVAELLGITNAGQSNRERIKMAIEALQNSTSTTADKIMYAQAA